jgi:hypothetical protein
MHRPFSKTRNCTATVVALIAAAATLMATAAAGAGACGAQAQHAQCVAACTLDAATVACALATRSNACLCAPQPGHQNCECFNAPAQRSSAAIVGLERTTSGVQKWVGAVFSGSPKLTPALADGINGLAAEPGTGAAQLCYLGCQWITANGTIHYYDRTSFTELGCSPYGEEFGVPIYGSCNVS